MGEFKKIWTSWAPCLTLVLQDNCMYSYMYIKCITVTKAAVPEIIDTVFAKTSPKRSYSMTEYERFGFVFTKTRVYKFGHWKVKKFRNHVPQVPVTQP